MITSTSNPRIKNVIQLLTNSKQRKEQHAYVIEGMKLFEEAPVNMMRQVFFTKEGYEKCSKIKPEIASLVVSSAPMLNLRGPECELVSDEVFKRMSDTRTPQGVLCVMDMPGEGLSHYLQSSDGKRRTGKSLVLILEGVQDPGNLGTMMRTGEAAGVDCILADRQTADVYNPKVIRSTMGAIYRVPVVYTDDLGASIRQLKRGGYGILAAHLKGESDYWDEDFPGRCGILIGNEGNGLSDEIAAMADKLIKIPMSGKVESLNAAVAAALMMYEWKRVQ